MIKDKIEVEAKHLQTISDLFYIGMARKINEPLTCLNGIQLNIGAGTYKTINGTKSIDYHEYDADNPNDSLLFEDEEVDVIHIYHVLEHLKNPKLILKECERVLKVGGYINIVVPYYNSSLYASCLDHKTMFNERTWKNTFEQYSYDNGTKDWKLSVHLNIIIGIEERNLALLTQLVKTD